MSNNGKSVQTKPKTEMVGATKNFYEKYGEAATQRNIVGRLLKFNKFGEYRAGQEEEQIARGTTLAADMSSLEAGYMRWQDNRPVEIVMGPVGEGYQPPPRSELGHTDKTKWDKFDDGRAKDPFQFTNSIILSRLDNEEPELFTFSTGSKGGLGAIGELAKTYGKHIRLKPDEMPIIELDVGSYQHPEYGEVRFPIFKVTGWIPRDKLPPIDGAPVSGGGNDSGGQPDLALPEPTDKTGPAKTAGLKKAAGFKI